MYLGGVGVVCWWDMDFFEIDIGILIEVMGRVVVIDINMNMGKRKGKGKGMRRVERVAWMCWVMMLRLRSS